MPLPAASSRGDQILNAQSFEKQGYSYLLKEEDMNEESLEAAIDYVYRNKADYIEAMSKSPMNDAIGIIVDLINEAAAAKK